MGNAHAGKDKAVPHLHTECGASAVREAAMSVPAASAADYPVGALPAPLTKDRASVGVPVAASGAVLELNCGGHAVPSVQLVGGKALKLMELSGLVSVPPGCVVTSAVYAEAVVTRLGLLFDAENERLLEEGHERILREAKLSPDVCAAVERVTAARGDVMWAVRSSATLEDGSEFSMAGLAESFLFVPATEVPQAIVKCWASLWSSRVGRYFQNADIDRTPLMAVVVQQMIVPRSAGVLFTLHPAFGTGEFMSLECVHGAGEALVSGAVTPAAFKVDVQRFTVVAETKKKQLVKLVQGADSIGLQEVPTTEAERESNPLSDSEMWNLVETGKHIAVHFGAPQDIEFVIDPSGVLHIVQTRPVTRFVCSHVPGSWFSGFAHKSWLAMTLSSMSGYYLSKTYGVKTALTEEQAIRPYFGIAFVSRELSKHEAKPVAIETVNAYLAHLADMEPLLWRIMVGLQKLPTPLLRGAVVGMLHERVELGFLSFSTGAECRALEKELEDEVLEQNSRAESSLHVHEMRELAAELRKHPHAKATLVAGRFDKFILDPFFKRVETYLRRHFYHCEIDEDVLETRWIDDPAVVLSMLRVHVLSEDAPTALADAPAASQEAKSKRSKSSKLVRFLDYMRAKDDVHEAYLRGNFFLCKLLQELNGRLNLPPNDIFYLHWRTLATWIEAGKTIEELHREITFHKYLRQSMRAWPRPTFFSRGGMPSFRAEAEAPKMERRADGLRYLSGTGGSPGLVTGECKVCATLNEAVAVIRKGDILVTEMTSPAWTPLFAVLGGVVTEHGGRLSHAAVVARECGLPAVLGVDGATRALATGTLVQVDGGAGTVAVLSKWVEAAKKAEEEERGEAAIVAEAAAEEEEELMDLSKSRDELSQSRNA